MYFGDEKEKYGTIEDLRKVARIDKLEISGRITQGIVKTGDFGYSSDIVDSVSGDTTYTRSTREADVIPFFFLFWIPEDYDEGIVILQNSGVFGIVGCIRRMIGLRFNSAFKNHRLHINPLIPKKAVTSMIKEGRIAKARFVKFGLPQDKADAIGHGHAESSFDVELVISAKEKNDVPIRERLSQFLSGKRDISSVLEMEAFAYDTLKLEVDLDGRSVTVDLSDFGRARPTYSVTNIEYGLDGHPKYESVKGEAIYLLQTLRNSMGIL